MIDLDASKKVPFQKRFLFSFYISKKGSLLSFSKMLILDESHNRCTQNINNVKVCANYAPVGVRLISY